MIKADKARDRHEPAQAAVFYRSILERWPPTFGILVQLGNALKDSGAFVEAEQAYQSALKMKPDDADCHLQLGHLMKLWGDVTKAHELYEKAHYLDPNLPGAIAELHDVEAKRMSVRDTVSLEASEPTALSGTTERLEDRAQVWDLNSRSQVICGRLLNEFTWRRG